MIVAATAAATSFVLINSKPAGAPQMSEEQRQTRERFFGSSNKELPPIEKGQEMRPRW
nr:entry exclusion protein TrbK [Shinella lacus]